MRIWFKKWQSNHMLDDMVVNITDDDTRTHKILNALTVICEKWDLSKPIWLDANIKEFQTMDKTRFYQDNFIDQIDFDYLEIHVIEE